jgi:hypothetical protein
VSSSCAAVQPCSSSTRALLINQAGTASQGSNEVHLACPSYSTAGFQILEEDQCSFTSPLNALSQLIDLVDRVARGRSGCSNQEVHQVGT